VNSLVREHLPATYFEEYQSLRTILTEILTADFTVENGMLTPKMSVRRNRVLEHYKDTVENLY